MKMKKNMVYFLSFLAIVFFVVGCVSVFRKTVTLNKNCTATTTGTITYVHYGGRHSSRKVTVVFQLEGKQYTAYSGDLYGAVKGQQVEVHYNPDKPSECYAGEKSYEQSRSNVYILAFIITALLVVFLSIRTKRAMKNLPDAETGELPDGTKITFNGIGNVKVEYPNSDDAPNDDEDRLV
ncbi:MAG: DUF3592 domain-containing protein [Clostridia bacterium]|nr:DUF3592 domain-containing protein [Clostridia bacterium]